MDMNNTTTTIRIGDHACEYLTCPRCDGEGEIQTDTIYHRGNHQDEGCIDRDIYEECSFCYGDGNILIPAGTIPHKDAISDAKDGFDLFNAMVEYGTEIHSEECPCDQGECERTSKLDIALAVFLFLGVVMLPWQ